MKKKFILLPLLLLIMSSLITPALMAQSNVKIDTAWRDQENGTYINPIRDIYISDFEVDSAKYSSYFYCTENIRLDDVSVNGIQLPEEPINETSPKTLDVY